MPKPYKTVSVCGCGWLGLALAENLVKDGIDVQGTKRSKEAAFDLSKKGIHGVVFDIYDQNRHSGEISEANSSSLFGSDVFVANIPPGRRTFDRTEFVVAMKSLVDRAKAGGTQQFIFISTTSVYGQAQGKISEDSVCHPNTESGIAHREIERYILEAFPNGGVVLRLSGLVGASRHPAKHMAGRTGITGGKDPVNLIHRDDCIRAISAIMKQQLGGETLHLSALDHPTRSDFYRWAAQAMGLPQPEFIEDGGEGKWISSDVTLQRLGMTLRYPSPYDMPLPALDS
ncbi:NAD(P)-dependent oxidoreductase [Enterovibrio norvegicus FF-162]|uniref:NAD(P)-dependent oxidoreductase n=1 Tax=Enterovibrio norvegicus FF-454 TaxID=1185651 RepID=A0A1E5C2D3_9GAMM|nr:SDR family oxidoreductase [Enterovibrio norvegicus]OEE59666.1 NAD(P)-dependent oxidoreductase [Enterovibrio norvegicus FF-454]OEE85597.1 NAD(P)-dependent oxidoreductase [Enterovibrio norvegicus FF-162]